MADVLNPEKARIFRITHRDNLPWILDHGLHAQKGASFDAHHRSIGNQDLIGKRTTHVVSVSPGGTLSDYISFYFTPFSMMLYNIHTGYNVPKIPNEEIVDSNGAGDAFAGAFIGKLILGGNIKTCVKAGQWLAGLCLRSNGPAYPAPLGLNTN